MPVQVINRETLRQKRFNSGYTSPVEIYHGDRDSNLKTENSRLYVPDFGVRMASERWENSEGQHKLYHEIRKLQKRVNEAQAPSTSDLEALLGKVFIDITRRSQEQGDLTSLFATELTNPNFRETITTREIYKYLGKMGEIAGTGDQVKLVEAKTGETDTFGLEIYGLGWAQSLKDALFNDLFAMTKVTQAVADADTDYRNSKVIGEIVGATYVASQKQAADTTSGATYDVKMYNTIRKAIKKLRGLKDYRTARPIAVPSIAILCNSQDTWSIERVINGQLTTGGANGTITTQNVQGLPVAQIIEYDQGITDGYTWMGETLDFDGVAAGTAYVFVPREYIWVANKRPLTLETGSGDVLALSQRRMAWYRIMQSWLKIFLGSSYSGTALGAGYGAIVEVTLPTDS